VTSAAGPFGFSAIHSGVPAGHTPIAFAQGAERDPESSGNPGNTSGGSSGGGSSGGGAGINAALGIAAAGATIAALALATEACLSGGDEGGLGSVFGASTTAEDAGGGSVLGITSSLSGGFAGGDSGGGIQALVCKEYVLDDIAFAIAKAAAAAMVNSVTDWVKSGFQGRPAFVTDIGSFLNEIDAGVLEEFLGSDTLAFLCSPWKFDVTLAIELNFGSGGRESPACSLGDIVDNIEGFHAIFRRREMPDAH